MRCWRAWNGIRSTEKARVHHAAQRRGGVAARGAGAASGTVGSRFLNSAAEQGFAGRVAAYRRGLGLAVA